MAMFSKNIELTSMGLLELICKEFQIEKEGSVMSIVFVNGEFEGVKLSYGEENR